MKNSFFVLCFIFGVLFLNSCNALNEQTLLLYARAKEQYANGRFSETSELLSQANRFVPALTLRGKAEYFSGDLGKAELSCRRAVKYRPQAFEAKLYLARILREKGETQNAEKIIFDLLSDNPNDIRTLRFASALAHQQGKIQEARIFLDQAAELSAESAMVLFDRARMHWEAGRSTQALEDLCRSRAILPWDTALAKSIENLELLIQDASAISSMDASPDNGRLSKEVER